MTGRNRNAVRLSLANLGREGLKAYLLSIGVAKELDSIMAFFDEWYSDSYSFFLSIDVEETIGSDSASRYFLMNPKSLMVYA